MILVTGASGYIGSHLVLSLCQDGKKVFCLVRKTTPKAQIDFLRSCGAEVVEGDLSDCAAFLPVIEGKVKRVVHLVGSIVASKKESFEAVHRGKTAAIVDLCKKINAEKIVLLTAVGAAPDAESEYSRTKWLAEEEVRKSSIPYVILRASLVFGNEGGLRNSKMLVKLSKMVRHFPVIPFIGSGKSLVQPVFIGDLVACLKKAVCDDSIVNKTFEIAGPEKMTFDELIQKIADHNDVRRIIMHIPTALMKPLADLLEKVLEAPPVSRDQMKLLEKDNVCDVTDMENTFPVKMVKFSEGFSL
ncbi:NAD-dependent epimerase/dehydratase family protein [Candidatus Auribacterota bacterium]